MSENIKQFLSSWCIIKHKPKPDYNITNIGSKQNVQFQCNVTVHGYDYVGSGVARNKKDAEANAAKNFTDYLLREKLISGQLEAPVNTVSRGCATSVSVPPVGPRPPMVGPRQMPIAGKSYWTNLPDQIKIVKVVKEEPKIDILGESLTEDPKSCLDLFLQQNGINAEYMCSECGPAHCKTFFCESSFYCPQLKRKISARENGTSKLLAIQSCALSSLRQLSRLNVTTNFEKLSAIQKFEQIPAFKVDVDPDVVKSIDEVLDSLGLKAISKPPIASQYNQLSMINDVSITDFAPQPCQRPQILQWSPPMPNWNAWMSCIIDTSNETVLSLEEVSRRLLYEAMQTCSRTFEERAKLAVSSYKGAILQAETEMQVVLIVGQPGCGKTTQVPQFILDHYIQLNRGAECNIVVTQPTRITALIAADRVSRDRGECLGQTCGYSVLFDTVLPQPYGGILYCTLGTFLRKMEAGLRGISHIIVDEIQERDSNTDFLLIILRNLARTYPGLKVVLMSSSADVQLFKNYFPGIFCIDIGGRSYPVSHYYLEDVIQMLDYKPTIKSDIKCEDGLEAMSVAGKSNGLDVNCNELCDDSYKPSTRMTMSKLPESEINFELIEALLKFIDKIHPEGAILVFLPGHSTIQMLLEHLRRNPIYNTNNFLILTLHSKVTVEDALRLFQPVKIGVRKIILSTKIAEACISIGDVMFVIDTCRERRKFSTLCKSATDDRGVWASAAGLEQRRRCAGRLGQGYTFHLCSRSRFERLEVRRTAEILRTPLYELILMIKLLRLGDTKSFFTNAIERPLFPAILENERFLKEMKALDYNDELTPLGFLLARLPLEPRMVKMILFGCLFGVADACSVLAAYTHLGDPFVVPRDRQRLTRQQVNLAGGRCSDHVAILNAYQKWDHVTRTNQLTEEMFCASKDLNLSVLKKTREASTQIKNVLKNAGFPGECMTSKFFDCRSQCPSLDTVVSLLVMALYPNVCYHKEKRKIITNHCKSSSLHKSSVTSSPSIDPFTSPFLMFGKKICTRTVTCKEVSMVNPIQLLLFGASKVVYQNQIIVIDDWLFLDAEFELVAKILALRPALNSLLVKGCMNPTVALCPHPVDVKLMSIVVKLGDPNACDHGRRKPFGVSVSGRRKRKHSESVTAFKAEKVIITENAKSDSIETVPVVTVDSTQSMTKFNSNPNLENDPIRSINAISRCSNFIQNAWSFSSRSASEVLSTSSSIHKVSNVKIERTSPSPTVSPDPVISVSHDIDTLATITTSGQCATKRTKNNLIHSSSTPNAGNYTAQRAHPTFIPQPGKPIIRHVVHQNSIPMSMMNSTMPKNSTSSAPETGSDPSKTVNLTHNNIPKKEPHRPHHQKSSTHSNTSSDHNSISLSANNSTISTNSCVSKVLTTESDPIKSLHVIRYNILKKVLHKPHDQKSSATVASTPLPLNNSCVTKLGSLAVTESDPSKTVPLTRNKFLKKVQHKQQKTNSKSSATNTLSINNLKKKVASVSTHNSASARSIETVPTSIKTREEDGMDFTSLNELEAKHIDTYGYPVQPPHGCYNVGKRIYIKQERNEDEYLFCDPITDEDDDDDDQSCGSVVAFSRRGIVTRWGCSRSRGAIVRNFRGREASPSSRR